MEQLLERFNSESLIFITVISLMTCYFHKNFTHTNVFKAPAILTTTGIFGTFIGFAVGLWDFNSNDVQSSVPKLIEGVKTAVWVSAWGIGCAITIKIRDLIWGIKKNVGTNNSEGATIDDLANVMSSISHSISGNDDSTLISQLKLTRQDSNDRLDTLNKSMNEFCEKVAESNSKALIEALKEVITDFNTKINEQFGENFKELNQAVEKILVWQDKYREQISEMIEQQSSTSKNMDIATQRYEVLINKAEDFNNISNNISNNMSVLIATIENQKTELNSSMEQLAKLINTASNGLPKIEENINLMTEQLKTGVKETNDEFKNLLLRTVQDSNKEFNNNINQIVEKTKEQVLVLDKALSEELTKSLESLGRQLAALSSRFADDYSPLTDKLSRVLDIARVAND